MPSRPAMAWRVVRYREEEVVGMPALETPARCQTFKRPQSGKGSVTRAQ
jgi:hypothetical protein